MVCYAVIDTNVIVSALLTKNKDAATVRVINQIIKGNVTPLVSEKIINEYKDVLKRKKFSLQKSIVESMILTFEQSGEMIEPAPSGEVLPDIKDLPFYEVVLEKKDDGAYLVTGNLKHFPKKPFVVTVNEFLQILGEE